MKIESMNKMGTVIRERNNYLVCIDEETEYMEEGGTKYTYFGVRVPLDYTYDTLVAAFIRERYSDDKMQAIINNYLMEPDNSEHEEEFKEMQAWRKHIKEVCKEIIG